ncbi:hypothetical protein EYC59_06430 [Candidatus Saccharibacteria bacterium]|nr:MAG: hypothetical protein EYC59_06430 [Candidatus Saccharibacteria bacterium]
MTLGINFGECSGDATTCTVTQQLFAQHDFHEVVAELAPESQAMCNVLGNIATMCAMGTCPGRNQEKALRVIHKIIDNRPQ